MKRDEIIRNRQAWADELRSGKYEQGQRALHLENSGKEAWCCLGVAACTLAKLYPDETEVKKESVAYVRPLEPWEAWADPNIGNRPGNGILSRAACEKLGLEYADPARDQHVFILANDSQGKNFEEIATMVEKLPLPEDAEEDSHA